MISDGPWLSAPQEHLWRGWMRLNTDLAAALQRDLHQDSGLSMSDYEVLVHLTDSPLGRVRVSDLARLLQWERSRVSHHASRMEGRGLVERAGCPEDGRGSFIAVTAAGRTAIGRAAPGHAAAVRRLVFDTLDAQEVACLQAVVEKLSDRLDETTGSGMPTS